MRGVLYSMALALLLGLFALPGLATVAHASGNYRNQARLIVPAHYQTVAYHRVYRERYYQPAPGYYYGPPYYYDYYYEQPGISIGLPFFYFHAG